MVQGLGLKSKMGSGSMVLGTLKRTRLGAKNVIGARMRLGAGTRERLGPLGAGSWYGDLTYDRG